MSLEPHIQHCFAAALTGFQVKPEDVIVGTQGPNGQYDCRVYDQTQKDTPVADGSFYGDESRGAVCITMLYDVALKRWHWPHTWHHFPVSTDPIDRPTN